MELGPTLGLGAGSAPLPLALPSGRALHLALSAALTAHAPGHAAVSVPCLAHAAPHPAASLTPGLCHSAGNQGGSGDRYDRKLQFFHVA